MKQFMALGPFLSQIKRILDLKKLWFEKKKYDETGFSGEESFGPLPILAIARKFEKNEAIF